MNKFIKLFLAFVSCLCITNTFAGIPNNDKPTTFLGPTIEGTYAGWFTDTSGFSFLGEAGVKNYRAGLTLGFKITDLQWVKLSAEYLWQNITYSFFSGNTNEWVQQGAAGLDYRFAMDCIMFSPIFDISAYYSHAPSKNLSTIKGFFPQHGIRTPFTNLRRIAGSNASGVAPGVGLSFWDGGEVVVSLNYDNVRYDKNYSPNVHNAAGLGGTARIQQMLGPISFGASAEVRKPFNNYAADIEWNNLSYYGRWSLGVFGDYTAGKEWLPNSYDVGISLNYFADECSCATARPNYKGDYKNEAPQHFMRDPNFLNWLHDPAVYMPQVLAIVDQSVKACTGGPVTFTGTIDGVISIFNTAIVPIDAASHFTGSNLQFSISVTPALTDGDMINISPAGIITASPGTTDDVHTNTYTVIVTAAGKCGTAISNPFTITLNGGSTG